MSNLHEAEIVADITDVSVSDSRVLESNEARELTDKIRRTLEFTWDMVASAYKGQAWAALGYSSWDEYCTREFGSQHISIPREERQEIVGSLREAGMSIRAIAVATGTSKDTVARSLSSIPTVSNETVGIPSDAPKIEGRNGKFYERSAPKPVTQETVSTSAQHETSGASFDEDQLPEEAGIFPLDTSAVLDRNAKVRVQNVQRLTGSSGKYSQAPLPMVIQLAGQIAHTSAGSEDLDLEETTALADNGSRAVLVLSQVLKTVDTTVILDAMTKQKIRANLNDAMDTIDEVLTLLEEG